MSKQKKRFLDRLRNRYRLVILDDQTFEEKASFRLTRFNVYVLFSTVLVLTIIAIFSLVIFTPLKEYIPGYGDINAHKEAVVMEVRSDSLTDVMKQRERWIVNLRNRLQGVVDTPAKPVPGKPVQYDTINLDRVSKEELKLREEIEREQNYYLNAGVQKKGEVTLSQLNLFPPLQGYVTSGFNPREDHFGIDVVAGSDMPIKCVMDGYVIMANWTLETGYVIAVQHDYNLVTFYKHNSVLLKKTGNFVKAGDAIAIIGSSGELTTGPHLHFELWHEGSPVNPEDYIDFLK